MNIVCVDDEPLVLGQILSQCKTLAQSPDVFGFTRSDEALAWLREHPADVCLLDIDMPDMNGLELANRVRELCPNASVIYVTAYDSFAVQAFEQHVSGYLLKPVSQERLQAEVDHALGSRPGNALAPGLATRSPPLAWRYALSARLTCWLTGRRSRSPARRQRSCWRTWRIGRVVA